MKNSKELMKNQRGGKIDRQIKGNVPNPGWEDSVLP